MKRTLILTAACSFVLAGVQTASASAKGGATRQMELSRSSAGIHEKVTAPSTVSTTRIKHTPLAGSARGGAVKQMEMVSPIPYRSSAIVMDVDVLHPKVAPPTGKGAAMNQVAIANRSVSKRSSGLVSR
ncbi:MAG: hypothetical protein HC841_05975 [Verrucomicrobiae bacterium]|nr:hypothetical protein [Verrucomicrobiae bacterium]